MNSENSHNSLSSLASFLRRREDEIAAELQKEVVNLVLFGGQAGQIEWRKLRAVNRIQRLVRALRSIDLSRTPDDYLGNAFFAARIAYNDSYADEDGGAWEIFDEVDQHYQSVGGERRTISTQWVRTVLAKRRELSKQFILNSSACTRQLDSFGMVLLQLENVDPVPLAARAVSGGQLMADDPVVALWQVLVNRGDAHQHLWLIYGLLVAVRDGPLFSPADIHKKIGGIEARIVEFFLMPTAQQGALKQFHVCISAYGGSSKSIQLHLCPLSAEEIDARISCASDSWVNQNHADELGMLLFGAVSLSSLNRVFVTPVGRIWALSLESLFRNGRAIGLDQQFIYRDISCLVTTPSEQRCPIDQVSKSLVVGGCDYDLAIENKQLTCIRRCEQLFEFLPGADEECKKVSEILGTRSIAGKDATRNNVVGVVDPPIAHFATHAFSEWPTERLKSPLRNFREEDQAEGYLDAGIVMSGANAYILEGRRALFNVEGLLTEADVRCMSLKKTFLVCLSCCDSAVGPVDEVSGPSSLASSFRMAGVSAVVSAVRPVNDAICLAFFSILYQEFVAGKWLSDAMHAARVAAITLPGGLDSFAFVLYGDDICITMNH